MLLQFISDEKYWFLFNSLAVRENAYMDDILSGKGIIQEGLASKTQTEILLMTEGFELNKWTGSHRILYNSQRLFSNSRRVGALDIIWNPKQDILVL